MADATVGLADTIYALRKELKKGIEAGKDEDLRFHLGPVEVELEVEVTKGGGGSFGVNIGVLTLGAKGDGASTSTHRLTVQLWPVDKSGEPIKMAGTSARELK